MGRRAVARVAVAPPSAACHPVRRDQETDGAQRSDRGPDPPELLDIVLRDRQHLAQDGIIIVVMTIDGDTGHVVAGPDIVTRGFVYVRDSGDLMSEAQSIVADTMYQLSDEGVTDWGRIKNEVKSSLSDYVWKQTQRSPMIIPIIMEI